MLLVYLTLPQLQLPLRTVGGEGWAGLQIGSMAILRIWYTMQSVVGKIKCSLPLCRMCIMPCLSGHLNARKARLMKMEGKFTTITRPGANVTQMPRGCPAITNVAPP